MSNRYLLATRAAKATRALHRPNSRIEDTLNEVFRLFARSGPAADVVAWPERQAAAVEHAVEQSELLRAG
jgi:hypothetical protein